MGGDNRTTQTTQQTTYPSYVEDAQKGLSSDLAKWYEAQKANGGGALAGLVPGQTKAIDAATGLLGNPGRNYAGDILAAGGASVTPATFSAANVNGADIVGQMNPFLKSVGADTLDAMRDEKLNADATRAAAFAASPTASGSDAVMAEALDNRNYRQGVSSTINNLLGQGYDQAQSMATTNAQMQQQANAANAGAKNQASEFNAGQKLSAAIAAGGAESDALNRKLSGISTALQAGSISQAQAQAELDRAWTLYQRYQSTLPGVGATQIGTAPDTSPTILQQLLGAGLTIGGMAVGGPAGAAGGSLLGNMLGGGK